MLANPLYTIYLTSHHCEVYVVGIFLLFEWNQFIIHFTVKRGMVDKRHLFPCCILCEDFLFSLQKAGIARFILHHYCLL